MSAVRVLVLGLVLAAFAAAPAWAADPASLFDAPGESHANVCVHLAGSSEPLRFGDGSADGFSLANDLSFYDGECPDGTVRLDDHEAIPSSAGALVFHRGGNGYNDAGNVKYGELATGDIADQLPPPVPASGGRGAACQLSSEPPYQVNVHSIPSEMHYKPGPGNSGSSFNHYGDPGADQGDRHDIHYSYLLWSFVDVRAGGHVRTLLAPNQVVRPCDVDPITMSSWDSQGNVNGQVTARYVRVLAGTCPLYGWMVWTHDYFGDSSGPVAHAVTATTTPPPDPTPDPNCPVQEPPSPPVVATGGAQPGDGAATVAGTVNPKGVPTTYHVDYGLEATYGQATPDASLGAADQDVGVALQLSGLQPLTTYHYRLVAANTHGVSDGADATFTTPAPVLPPPPPLQVHAAAAPPALANLRLSPKSFRRARSRTKTAAHIRYTLTSKAKVTITFLRKATGVRRGNSCVAPPRHHASRHADRCTRWIELKGQLREPARAGRQSIAFSGWLRGKPLARGAYRVRAVPLDPTGNAGQTKLAGFKLK